MSGLLQSVLLSLEVGYPNEELNPSFLSYGNVAYFYNCGELFDLMGIGWKVVALMLLA
jgi:hypothetical protein